MNTIPLRDAFNMIFDKAKIIGLGDSETLEMLQEFIKDLKSGKIRSLKITKERRIRQYDDADKALPDNVESDRRGIPYTYKRRTVN